MWTKQLEERTLALREPPAVAVEEEEAGPPSRRREVKAETVLDRERRAHRVVQLESVEPSAGDEVGDRHRLARAAVVGGMDRVLEPVPVERLPEPIRVGSGPKLVSTGTPM